MNHAANEVNYVCFVFDFMSSLWFTPLEIWCYILSEYKCFNLAFIYVHVYFSDTDADC